MSSFSFTLFRGTMTVAQRSVQAVEKKETKEFSFLDALKQRIANGLQEKHPAALHKYEISHPLEAKLRDVMDGFYSRVPGFPRDNRGIEKIAAVITSFLNDRPEEEFHQRHGLFYSTHLSPSPKFSIELLISLLVDKLSDKTREKAVPFEPEVPRSPGFSGQ